MASNASTVDPYAKGGPLYAALDKQMATRRSELYAWAILVGSFAFFGGFVNLLVLIAAWPRRTRKSSFDILISHFVMIHVFYCLVNVPTYVIMVRSRIDGRTMPPNICNYMQTMVTISSAVINWSDAGMAVNRCIALFFPLHYKKWTTSFANVCIIGTAWIASLTGLGILVFSPEVGFSSIMRLTMVGICNLSLNFGGPLAYYTPIILTFIPYSIAGAGAVLILIKSTLIARRARALTVRPFDAPSLALQYRLKLARMLLFTFLWTAICNAPGYVTNYYFGAALGRDQVSAIWLRLTQPIQYGLTPCIMLLSNDGYRKRLYAMASKNVLDLMRSSTGRSYPNSAVSPALMESELR